MITHMSVNLSLSNPDNETFEKIRHLMTNLVDAKKNIPTLWKFEFTPLDTTGTGINQITKYSSKFTSSDGRVFEQHLYMKKNNTDPFMEFFVIGNWKLSEILFLRVPRDLVVSLISTSGVGTGSSFSVIY